MREAASPRAKTIAVNCDQLKEPALDNDVEGMRAVHALIGRLIGDHIRIEGAEVVDLDVERRNRDR